MSAEATPLVRVEELRKWFPVETRIQLGRQVRRRAYVRAVDDVSFSILPGEVLGIVGESGSGKSTVGRLLLRLIEPTAGRVTFDGHDLGALSAAELRAMRARMQVVFQDPLASLNPRMTIGAAIAHPVAIHQHGLSAAEQRDRVHEILERVGLTPPEQHAAKYPHQLSGGQRQRAVIARALVTSPDFVVADEPLAMADVSVRALLLDLLLELKQSLGLTYLFITHDLATAKYICDRVAIMYLGRIVEIGPLAEIYRAPRHPYTQALLDAVPVADPTRRRSGPLPVGEIPDPRNPPSGCRFHPRCPLARPGLCDVVEPPLVPLGIDGSHQVGCHVAAEQAAAAPSA